MTLAESPEVANARRQPERSKAETTPPAGGDRVLYDYSAQDDSPAQVVGLRNVLKGWHWQGYQRIFQILEIVCPTDRAFERARKQMLDVANDQERTMSIIINRMLGGDKEPAKAEETK